MSAPAPAPSPPAGAPPPGLLYCNECGAAVRPLPTRPSSPPRVCPSCCRGFLEENPPPPPPPPESFYCYDCGATVNLQLQQHSALPAPVPPSSPPRVCPCCHRGFLAENPHARSPSPPPPPPFFGSGSSSSELSDDPDDDGGDVELLGAGYDATRDNIRRILDRGSSVERLLADLAAFRHQFHRPAVELQRQAAGLPPAPAPAASIAALPTVEVAEPATACAICKEDLPLASEARKLPCEHLYHSSCIVTWLEMHNSCPVCRFRIPSAAAPSEQDSPPTRITIRFTTTARRRSRVHTDAAAPVSASPTQLAQALTGDGAGGPANSGETVSSEWPPHPESDTVMSEARDGDGFFD